MEENQLLISLITGLIVLAFGTSLYGSSPNSESIRALEGNMSPLLITRTSGDVGIEAVRGDNYYYKITAMPKLSVSGIEEADVIAVVEFKGITARGKFQTDRGFDDKIHVAPRDSFQPKIIAEMYSDIPPISEFSSNPFHRGVQVFIKNNNAAPLLITLTSLEEKRNIMANGLLNMLKKKCYAKFELRCQGQTVYTSALTACADGEDYKCEQNIEMCGGNVKVNILDEPDCGGNTANADIRYEGKKIFEVTESVWVSFWKESMLEDATCRIMDIKLLMGYCQKYRVGRFELESGLINVG